MANTSRPASNTEHCRSRAPCERWERLLRHQIVFVCEAVFQSRRFLGQRHCVIVADLPESRHSRRLQTVELARSLLSVLRSQVTLHAASRSRVLVFDITPEIIFWYSKLPSVSRLPKRRGRRPACELRRRSSKVKPRAVNRVFQAGLDAFRGRALNRAAVGSSPCTGGPHG